MDAAGRSLDLTKAPTRIVSLVPSVSAIFLALGEAGRLAGRTDYDTAQSFSELPSVGGGLQPSLEVLVSLQPDLVIRFAGPSDPSTPERLDDLGIAHYAVRPDGISDVKRIIQEMGLVSGRALTADAIVAEIDEALVDIAVRVAPYPPVRTAFVLGGTPPIVAGPGTFVHELIRLGGGINVFSDLTDLYAPVSAEEIVARGADVYLTVPGSTFDASLVPRTPVREVSEGAQLPGPNLGSIAREVARALHPEAFP